MSRTLYILLPVHNRRDITAKFVACLKAQTFFEWHLVLVDDGSRDGTAEMVCRAVDQVTVIKGDGNLWWGGALEKGYRWLQAHPETLADLVLIANDDTVFEPDFLARGVELLERRPHTLLQACCFSKQTERLLDRGTHVDWRRLRFDNARDSAEVNCLSTRGLFLRVADFMKTGGFRPRLLPHYGSDYEFTIRARRQGMRLEVDPSLKLWVDEQATGYQQALTAGFFNSLRRLFSNRALANPMRWFFFIMLACPPQWKLLALARVFWGTLLQLSTFIRGPKRETRC